MFQSCPSGRGPIDKINLVSSNIPSKSSISRAIAPAECVPLTLTYIRRSRHMCDLLGLNCWFKISTDSAHSPSCITHCGSLAQTPCIVSQLSTFTHPLHLIRHCLSVSCMSSLSQVLSACLTVCISSSFCLLLLQVISVCFPAIGILCIHYVYGAFD